MLNTTSFLLALSLTSSIVLGASAQDGTAPAKAPATTAPAAEKTPAAESIEYAILSTTKGPILIELDRAKAPISVENFVSYITSGHFDNTVFHRVMPGFVIQGGGFNADGVQKSTQAPIKNEGKNGLKNSRGTLSMARTPDPNSATSQFFISLKDNDMLDASPATGAGYAVFGKVLVGMKVVDEIAKVKTGVKHGMSDWPTADVLLTKVVMVSKADADKLIEASKAPAAAPTTPAAAPTAPATK